ncbi:hypothetical protein HOLleu_05843 [Holothuria leucospilota]|uniref:Uncharacterized protein n=1 Tax=Holothuria leucospilota TaxID=206669 RepID=A0A9Q1HJ72_HOLLE|nr:hypothetical protein HOLleu_05843 [Holothuria leucospilota]
MDDIGTQGNYENYLVPNQSLPYASPSYKDFSSLRALHHVYMKKTTRAVEPTEDHEEDYMNSFREDVYSNTQI